MMMGFAISRYDHGSELKFVAVVVERMLLENGIIVRVVTLSLYVIGMDRRQIILILHIVFVGVTKHINSYNK